MMIRLPYAYVSQQIEKMYEKSFQETDPADLEAVNKSCEFIQDFIAACGWEMDDFIRVMMGYDMEVTSNGN